MHFMSKKSLSPFLTMAPIALAASLAIVVVVGCETEDATTVVVDNQYPDAVDASPSIVANVIYRASWVTTYFDVPVAPGTSSESLRGVPNSDTAYVLLAPGWDPTSAEAPSAFAVRQSIVPFSSTRGHELHIGVSDETFTGNCVAGKALSDVDRAFLVERIFPLELTKLTYDPNTCLFTRTPDTSDVREGG